MASSRPSVFVFFGQDDFQVHNAATRQMGPSDPSLGDLNRTHLEAAKLTPNQLNEHLQAVPFLADERIVRVDGLLGRFDSAGRGKAQGELANTFAGIIELCPETTRLILVDGALDEKKNILLPHLKAMKATIQSFRPLKGAPLVKWINEEAANEKAAFNPAAVQTLARLVGDNLWTLHSEIQKLATYADGDPITEETVTDMVSAAHEERLYLIIDAALSGKAAAALADLIPLLDSGVSPFQVFAVIQGRVRQAWVLQHYLDRGAPMAAAQARAGLTYLSDYQFGPLSTIVQRRPKGFFTALHQRLLTTDAALKTGRAEPRLALETLITSL